MERSLSPHVATLRDPASTPAALLPALRAVAEQLERRHLLSTSAAAAAASDQYCLDMGWDLFELTIPHLALASAPTSTSTPTSTPTSTSSSPSASPAADVRDAARRVVAGLARRASPKELHLVACQHLFFHDDDAVLSLLELQ